MNKKHPILLAGHDNFAELIIRKCHERTGHAGLSETLTDLRERFFVLKGRPRVKTLIGKCNLCKILRTKPATQNMASLPLDRGREAFPFEVTGIDYLGPLYTKEKESSESKKCYILSFTCAVTRSVHLELSPDMTAATFLNVLKKFITRRGLCKIVYSDNAKKFHKVKEELNLLNETLKESKCQDYFSEKRIKWKNNIEKTAWWGGWILGVTYTLCKVLTQENSI
nr:uncharacterized protein LOC107456473 [Parasteatoda tepidariorum]